MADRRSNERLLFGIAYDQLNDRCEGVLLPDSFWPKGRRSAFEPLARKPDITNPRN
jgi:hypothetical protein